MNILNIKAVLDATRKAKAQGKKFIPLFSGDPGIGKSETVQAWAKEQKASDGGKYGFIDMRPAYVEAPDFIGLVSIRSGRTMYNLPEFWPTEGEGIILLEEVNRANPSVMNALMQLLTDFKVMNYEVPEGWIIAAVINPESADCDVQSMDSAFRNRFTIFEVNYSKDVFVDFVQKQAWHPPLAAWIKEYFVYNRPNEIAEGNVFVSPRSLSKLNTIEQVSDDPIVRAETINSVLGKHYAPGYVDYTNNNRPLFAEDFIRNKAEAFTRLKDITEKIEDFRGDVLTGMLDSVVTAIIEKKLPLEFTFELADQLPADLVGNLLVSVADKGEESDSDLNFEEFFTKNNEKIDAYVAKKNAIRKE